MAENSEVRIQAAPQLVAYFEVSRVLAFCEGFVAMLQFYFVFQLINSVFLPVNGILNTIVPESARNLPSAVLAAAFMLLYMCRIYSHTIISPTYPLKPVYPLPYSLLTERWFTKTMIFILIAQLIEIVGIYVYEQFTSEQIFTSINYRNLEGEFDMTHALLIIVITPVCEEIVFRQIVLGLMLRRFNRFINERSPIQACIVSSILFAIPHLFNFMDKRYNHVYVILQVIAAILVGSFLAMQRLYYSSLTSCILIHIVNNVVASVTSTKLELIDVNSKFFAVQIGWGLLSYILLNIYMIRLLNRQWTDNKKFNK